jgi:hypothetical protein
LEISVSTNQVTVARRADEVRHKVASAFYFAAGIAFLSLAKIKHAINGYNTPKPISMSRMSDCVEYDLNVVNDWRHYGMRYVGEKFSFRDKNILELGPGSDIGTGISLLYQGARQYNACDVHALEASVSPAFYDMLLEAIASKTGCSQSDSEARIREEYCKLKRNEPS